VKILVINTGSSSVKHSLIDVTTGDVLSTGSVERIACPGTRMKVRAQDGRSEERDASEIATTKDAIAGIARALTDGPAGVLRDLDGIDAVGHRVVQGGVAYSNAAVVDSHVKAAIQEYAALAPLHNPANLAGILAAEELLPGKTHVAVFDTAFHATMPPRARYYGLPLEFARRHRIMRYGFHGSSHQYVSARAREMLGSPAHSRIVTAHIGNGVSLCAVCDGKSVDTTMGFTPLEGVIMGTRSGSVDPAAILYMISDLGRTPAQVDKLLNKESGLLGMAGVGSGDLRDVLAARTKGNEGAAIAFDAYVYRLAQAVSAMTLAMRGMDALVFTAGAGENSPELRSAVCEQLDFLGIAIDAKKNAAVRGDGEIGARTATTRTFVVKTHEDMVIAKQTARLVGGL
jgi:acetate kinase